MSLLEGRPWATIEAGPAGAAGMVSSAFGRAGGRRKPVRVKESRKPTGLGNRGEKGWALVRLTLGMMQMTGAVVSFYLLLRTGMNDLSLSAVAFTCLCTTVSVLLFGGRGGKS
jgi:hypothetical protein